ncbi:hypothetical protein C4K35_5940 [Pseudomonas chlororaphis subsp. piscium]|nr:hypothetical protein C4K35_5940 [Pseudomonas chlororaphis subsp. piscium]AZC59778.1 hypothetical protein C4K34_5648 [Pseudomonas chlororaphis subsp. piscium]AZC65959.1 hypothetical protein C4K33_5502 [Pseudomonas chlororaphis subsp. piscium]AZC72185.1 hypothetical protein C4K32_5558 [Pseudomonas chlororaphis subsp. piscium]AZC78439.1 hypothetical protein C4K31_5571 [Pseudomonas chlororaphis subsp. piscium]
MRMSYSKNILCPADKKVYRQKRKRQVQKKRTTWRMGK